MLGRVIRLPGRVIGLLPFRIRHLWVVRHAVAQIVFVEVGVHPDPLLQLHLVVLGSRQRRQKEKFEQVERQFAFDDLDVAQDRPLRVAWEAEDVAGAGDGAGVSPLLQHGAIFGDLVLVLLGSQQIVGIDVFEADEDAAHPGLGDLLNKVRNAVTQRVDLDREGELQIVGRAHRDQPVGQLLPIAVAGEIVVGNEEPADPPRIMLADAAFEVVGGPVPTLSALHVDDRAERALVGAAAAEIDARKRAGGAADMLFRENRHGLVVQRR